MNLPDGSGPLFHPLFIIVSHIRGTLRVNLLTNEKKFFLQHWAETAGESLQDGGESEPPDAASPTSGPAPELPNP